MPAMLNGLKVKALIKELHSPDYTLRQQAIDTLGESGDSSVVKPLIECLLLIDTDWNTHEAAALALAKLKDAQAIPALLSVLRSSERQGGSAVAYALGQMGPPALPSLLDLLQTTQDHVMRRAATFALSCMGISAVQALIELLQNDQQVVRWGAIHALEGIRDPRAVEPLLALLSTADWQTKLYILDALGNIGDPRAVEPLIAGLRDPDPYILERTVRALASAGDRRALPELERLARASQNSGATEDFRYWVRHAIKSIEKREKKASE
jgi:HEAT repeat protein